MGLFTEPLTVKSSYFIMIVNEQSNDLLFDNVTKKNWRFVTLMGVG